MKVPPPPWHILNSVRAAIYIAALGLLAAVPTKASAEVGDCAPAVELEGEATLVSQLRTALQARGVASGASACGTLTVRATALPDGVSLHVDAGDGLLADRVASNPNAAATMIESFVRPDLVAPLLDRAIPEPKPKKKKVAVEQIPTQTEVEAHEARPFTLGGGAVFGVGSDGSTWTGGELVGCVQVSSVCVGGRFQAAFDGGWTGHSASLETTRVTLDVGATAELPLELGAARIVPGVGLGMGTTRVARTFAGSEVGDDEGGLRLRGQVALDVPIGRLSIHVKSAVEVLPFAEKTMLEGAIEDGPETVPLAGQPVVVGWLSAGIRIGGF